MHVRTRWFIGFGVFTALVVGLLVWGLLNYSEPGLLQVCFDTRGKMLGTSENCPELVWDKQDIPIKVSVRSYVENGVFKVKTVKDAIKDFNRDVDFKLFEYVEDGKDARVYVLVNAPVEVNSTQPFALKDAGGVTEFDRAASDGKLRVEIRIGNVTQIGPAYCAAYHELGHASGLADDDFSASYMDSKITSADCSMKKHLTDWDKDILIKKYK